jgi:hypothetical protein
MCVCLCVCMCVLFACSATDPSPHVPVPFQDVVDFLRPFGATKPGGFLEYVWINACHTDTLVDQLQRECGVPFVFGRCCSCFWGAVCVW